MLTGDEIHDEILPFLEEPQDGSTWRAPAAREQRLYELCQEDEAGNERAGYEYLRFIAAEGSIGPCPWRPPQAAKGSRR